MYVGMLTSLTTPCTRKVYKHSVTT